MVSSPGARRRWRDEPPLVEVVAHGATRCHCSRRRRRSQTRRRSTARGGSSDAPRRSPTESDTRLTPWVCEKPRCSSVAGGEAMEVVAQRRHEIPLGQHRTAVVDAGADEEPQSCRPERKMPSSSAGQYWMAPRPARQRHFLPDAARRGRSMRRRGAQRAEIGARRRPGCCGTCRRRRWPRGRPGIRACRAGASHRARSSGRWTAARVISVTITSCSRLLAPIAPTRA